MNVSIRIKEHLARSWQERLGGLQILHEPDGTSRLVGSLPDQSALHGVLATLGRLNLTLLSLDRSETRPEES